ncbi:efflux transporter outer membrane subunit [Desulfobacter curvatus]|uniref:efflux transporter outer membrane subunit n=1 Tax=Desulfobacter curvatus TaxID=2290 RepID=UPI0003778AF5|nr:TolC family protein [Desulfobacter curvatus]
MFKPYLQHQLLTHILHYPLQLSTVIVLAVALTGCAIGPDYRPPAMPESAVGHFVTQIEGVDEMTPLPSEWWKLYNDPVLNGLIRDAFAANTDLRVSLANLERAQEIFNEANSGLFPSTTTSGGVSNGRDQTSWSGTGQAPRQWSYSGGLEVSYELDLFGRVRRDIEAAHYNTDAVAAAHDAVRVIVAAETTRAYVDICTLGEAIAVARFSIELANQSLRIVRDQQRAGSASRLDVKRAGVSQAQAEAALPPLQGRREAALFELAALTGRTPAQVPGIVRTCVKAPEITHPLPVGDGTALLRRRPDVRQAERQLAVATARIGVSVADLYPHINLGTSGAYLRNDSLKGDRTLSFAVGPLISWTFPNISVARSRVAQAKAESAATLATFDGVVLTALKEIEQALAGYGATLKERGALIEARDSAEQAYELADQRYRSGSISYLDVIVAQTVFIDAKAQVATVDQRVGSARVSVFKALGGGWKNADTWTGNLTGSPDG